LYSQATGGRPEGWLKRLDAVTAMLDRLVAIVSLSPETEMNPLDRVEELVNPDPTAPSWDLKAFPRPHRRYDATLFRRDRAYIDRQLLDSTKAALEDCRLVADVKALSDRNLYVRLADEALRATASALEEGELLEIGDLAAGRTVVVDFCDPNATKALHVGHLRNIALGHALSSALRHVGARVETRSIVTDFGRNMAEAMAAVWTSRAEVLRDGADDPERVAERVGERYRAYIASGSRSDTERTSAVDSPMAREMQLHGDLADELLARALARDDEVLSFGRALSGLVIDSQIHTLSRLGVRFDNILRESDFIRHAQTVAAIGVARGILSRTQEGSVIYASEQGDSVVLQLLRADGAPTQHLRGIVYWLNTEAEVPDATTVRYAGDEWSLHAACSRELRSRLLGRDPAELNPNVHIFHSMVSMNGQTVTSSHGEPVLIDDLLDWLAEQISSRKPAAAALAGLADQIDPQSAAAQIALGFFLTRPPTAAIDFTPARLLTPHGGLGQLLLMARNRSNPAASPPGEPRSERCDDPMYRFAIVQSAVLPRQLRRLVDGYDVVTFARYVHNLAGWQAKAERELGGASVATAVLDRGAHILGLTGSASARTHAEAY
jgi:arginyl-tRNA synthetase